MVKITLEEFREKIEKEYSEKGIIPPAIDSLEEQVLFRHWLTGAEKLKKKIHD